MKKHLLVLILTFWQLKSFAQNEDYGNVISVQTGASLFTPFRGEVKGSEESADTVISFSAGRIHKYPQINIAYDRAIKPWFSIGGSMSYNRIAADLENVKYHRTEDLGSFTLDMTRVTVGARALFHYGNANRLDMYSGLRLGIGIWAVSASSSLVSDLDNKAGQIAKEIGNSGLWRTFVGDKIRGRFALPQAQLILFGIRGYITEHIGINGELSIGSPYFASIGINYRFGGGQDDW
jgi:hypothetical protein